MTLDDKNSIRFNAYGTGTHSGTAVNLLGVDANGNVIESSKADAEKNIYNSDGAFTQNRIINTNDHPISFQNSAGRDFSIIPADPSNIELPFIFKTSNAFTFQVDSFDALAIDHQSHIRFGRYGDVTQQIGRTAVFQLGVDATGKVLEMPLPESNPNLQYYIYNYIASTFTSPPNITTVRSSKKADAFGHLSGSISSSGYTLTGTQPSQNTYFIVKITGYYFVKNAGSFDFSSDSDDGARIYIDGSLILDAWTDGGPKTGTGTVNLGRGKHRFEFWYYQNTGIPDFSFSWGTNPDSRSGVIDANQFTID